MMTCAYYRRNEDGTFWAIRLQDRHIVQAIGPVSAGEMQSPPMARRSATATDVAGWRIEDFSLVSDEWMLSRKTPLGAGTNHPIEGQRQLQHDGGTFDLRLAAGR